jgi:hypothetical protein
MPGRVITHHHAAAEADLARIQLPLKLFAEEREPAKDTSDSP